ncbi:MAG TPA: SDR family oxidoreductase [Candidatus Binataceae bacterium]|nr:SDR family oxidoreductase [Candidatus Binataceae bacterium]
MGQLDGKIALVTGAGRSVGLGIAQELAEAGASVAVNDLHPERAEGALSQINAAGGRLIAAPFDAANLEAVRAGITRVEQTLGPIDILVNNAGITEGIGMTGPFVDSDPAQWHFNIDLNLYGSMYCIRTVLPGMARRRWGRIIQISSGAGSRGVPNVSIYSAAKAGIEGLLRCVAIEMAQSGVTLNAIALGLMANTGERMGDSPMLQRVFNTIPMGRLGQPREIGACAVWLASNNAAYVTGQTIHVNGGSVHGR